MHGYPEKPDPHTSPNPISRNIEGLSFHEMCSNYNEPIQCFFTFLMKDDNIFYVALLTGIQYEIK